MRGDPKFILARDCYGTLSRHRARGELSGTRGGLLYNFTLSVYAFATGEHPEDVTGRGEDYAAGLVPHVQAAAQICGALAEIEARGGEGEPLAPLTEEEMHRRASLWAALATGRVPACLHR